MYNNCVDVTTSTRTHLLNTQPVMKSTAMYNDTALDMLFSLSSLMEVEPEIMFHAELHALNTQLVPLQLAQAIIA